MGNTNSRKRSNSTYVTPNIYSPTLNRSRSKSVLQSNDQPPSSITSNLNNTNNLIGQNDLVVPNIDINNSPQLKQTNERVSLNVPENIVSDITISNNEIDLSFKNLNNLSDSQMSIQIQKHCNELVKIDLSQNCYKSIPSWIYNNTFHSLVTLNFYQNEIEILNSNEFQQLVKLDKLILSQNKIEYDHESPKDIFSSLHSLRSLMLSSNQFKSIPSLVKLEKLERLALDRNAISNYPSDDQLELLPINLKFLSISYNHLTMVPSYIINPHSQLETLEIFNNKISEIPKEIGQLRHLKHLNMSSNSIESLPEQLYQLVFLETLELQMNKLTKIPEDLGSLVNLQLLNLSNNQIQEIPKSINYLCNLTILYLDNNIIEDLPLVPDNQLIRLSEIYLNSNKFQSMQSLCNLASIDKISMGFNKIQSLPENLNQCCKLSKLELSDNQISLIPSSIVQLKHLYEISLANNNIDSLPSAMYKMTLQDLNLTKNPILRKIPKQLQRKGLQGIKEYLKDLNDK
ncbi:hypothetical protein DLAC_03066 [Tieghemostelium lacteum]|uniref:Disease resistance R13L4/SHOC-2-like LRR domain-containing protein n=1 Tax=Tieghemostelium lacteum TaxID=361077 RepID=A0A152A246_TIELA|nr:hypothetical protein DLAC_03066 [Tieghemostelium lacteum]|eukprot:KYR00323.1 hypothetical protein DLAC_03066 [Tieghemostelium lacteum]